MNNDIRNYVLSKSKALGIEAGLVIENIYAYSNSIYKIQFDSTTVVLKIISDPIINEAKIAEKEITLLNKFKTISPKVLLYDSFKNNPAIFMEYLRGSTLDKLRVTKRRLQETAELLYKINSAKITPELGRLLDRRYLKVPNENLYGIENWLRSFRKSDPIISKTISVYKKIHSFYVKNITNFKPVLCHGDFKLSNVIQTRSSLKAFDWELAILGDAAFDIGVLFFTSEFEKRLTENERRAFLDRYIEISKDEGLESRVNIYYNIANLQALLWDIRELLSYKSKGWSNRDKERKRGKIMETLDKLESAKFSKGKRELLYVL